MTTTIPLLPESEELKRARDQWQYRGNGRPEFADTPSTAQESVWDYPRPPLIERCTQTLIVKTVERVLAETTQGVRVLETAGAPTYYFPPQDVDDSLLEWGEITSICEWKGAAQTAHLRSPSGTAAGAGVGWRYAQMFPAFLELHLWPSFYPNQLECFVGKERVTPQPGGFYGGWVTKNLAGPIKGEPKSSHW